MVNEYTKKKVKCPLSGKYCDRKDKNCNICLAEEEEWEEKGNC